MGCDVHAHVELKIDGEWHHYNHPWVSRCYPLFSLLAGVRRSGDIEPYSEPRGLPSDATMITRLELGDPYMHSQSYINSHEFIKVLERWHEFCALPGNEDYPTDLFTHYFGYIMGYEFPVRMPLHLPIEDVRLVFGFDS
jgi:hypothetical protein